MAALTTTTQATSMGSAIGVYYEKRFLMRAEENFVYEPLGVAGRIPKGEGKTVVWNRLSSPTAKTTAITEGTDPTPSGVSATLVSATLSQYGNFETVTDLLEMTAIDTTVKEVMDLMAYEAAKSIDQVIINAIKTSGTQLIASGVVARNSLVDANVVTVADIRKAVRNLNRMAAQPHTRDRYVATAHPDVIYDLQGDSNWVNAHIYTEKGIDSVYNGEAGELYGVRFVMTQQAPVLSGSGSTSTQDVNLTHIMGKDFFGVSKLQNLVTYVDSPSPRSTLRLWSDIGWKAAFAVKALNDSFCQRIESGATA